MTTLHVSTVRRHHSAPTSVRRGRGGVSVLDTTEIRWFLVGQLPGDVRRWFIGPAAAPAETRRDRYLLKSVRTSVSVSRNGETLELKTCLQTGPALELAGGLVGVVERWRKVDAGGRTRPTLGLGEVDRRRQVDREAAIRAGRSGGRVLTDARRWSVLRRRDRRRRGRGATAWSFAFAASGSAVEPTRRHRCGVAGPRAGRSTDDQRAGARPRREHGVSGMARRSSPVTRPHAEATPVVDQAVVHETSVEPTVTDGEAPIRLRQRLTAPRLVRRMDRDAGPVVGVTAAVVAAPIRPIQAVISAICVAVGYGLGGFVGRVVAHRPARRRDHLPSPATRRTHRRASAAVTVVGSAWVRPLDPVATRSARALVELEACRGVGAGDARPHRARERMIIEIASPQAPRGKASIAPWRSECSGEQPLDRRHDRGRRPADRLEFRAQSFADWADTNSVPSTGPRPRASSCPRRRPRREARRRSSTGTRWDSKDAIRRRSPDDREHRIVRP